MKIQLRLFFIFLFFWGFGSILSAQKKIRAYTDYIDHYTALAIKQMDKYKIPASITLAQGLLESGAGLSALTRNPIIISGLNAIRIGPASEFTGRTTVRTIVSGNIKKRKILLKIIRSFCSNIPAIPFCLLMI